VLPGHRPDEFGRVGERQSGGRDVQGLGRVAADDRDRVGRRGEGGLRDPASTVLSATIGVNVAADARTRAARAPPSGRYWTSAAANTKTV
jgi:hypothetical protein